MIYIPVFIYTCKHFTPSFLRTLLLCVRFFFGCVERGVYTVWGLTFVSLFVRLFDRHHKDIYPVPVALYVCRVVVVFICSAGLRIGDVLAVMLKCLWMCM